MRKELPLSVSKTIYLDAPSVGTSERRYLNKAVDTGYVSSVGQFVPDFEERFARYVGAKRAVSTQSGTAAIHMALHELGIGRGDEVIVPVLTFIASVNPVVYVGAKPVFADVDSQTWNIDPNDIERLITKKTKAIVPVHLYGNPCDMSAIMKIARRYRLHVIEDATESLGATYRGNHTGTLGDFGCFSFNGNKIITTGGGGMVVGKNARKIEHIKFLVNQAKDAIDSGYHPEVGFNYRMTNIEAALGLAQFEKIDKFLSKKREINFIYRDELKGVDCIRFQTECPSAASSYWFTCVTFENNVDLARLQRRLKMCGIPTRRIFMPIIEFPPYKRCKKCACRRSYDLYARSLCLASSLLNSRDDIYFVAKTIRKLVTQ
jgi:perosamine synthetase